MGTISKTHRNASLEQPLKEGGITMYQQSVNSYEISSGEYCMNVEDIPETPEEMKVYIPKLMTNIELGDGPNEEIMLITNPSIFINGSGCKVDGILPVLTGQNFVTLKPYGNEYPNFRSKAIDMGGEYIVPKHNKFILEVQHNDIRSMYFTGKE